MVDSAQELSIRWGSPFADGSWETEIAGFIAAIQEGGRPNQGA